ncbi:MAG: sensor histidine kinase [Anaerolineales bacterium]|nr:sensor histidine kinase [Anaerolineales bacterium]
MTLSYTVVTVATLLVVEIILVGGAGYLIVNSNILPNALTIAIEIFIAPQIETYLDQPQPDIESLNRWLERIYKEGLTFQSPDNPSVSFHLGDLDQSASIIILDENSNYITTVPKLSEPVPEEILELSDQTLSAARAGEKNPERILSTSDYDSLIAVPLTSSSGDILGIVILSISTTPSGSLSDFAAFIGGSLILFTVASGIIGTVFGFFTARGFTRRMGKVSQAADSWSKGDFSKFIHDHSNDELGQLAQHLNRMAEQLQNLMQTKEELATLEERNRLARELHDSVKQQVFATTMQVGAAQSSLDLDPQAAKEHLAEAGQLSRQAQKELTSLIHELRPVSLGDQPLPAALKAYTVDWARQNEIDVDVNIKGERNLPLALEQTIFRVAQEVLANIARHSRATKAEVQLVCEREEIVLSITDNGVGFDYNSASDKGVGLRSMAERIAAVDGDLNIDSARGRGTRIVAKCPIDGGS